jgi:Prokaryotic ubiquitin-like protein UBact
MAAIFIETKFCHWHVRLTSGFAEIKRRAPLRFQLLLVRFFMPERIQKPVEPAPWGPKQGDGGEPRSPDISRPDTKDLLKKMRKVDPNQSKRYRQRTGQ